MDIKGEPAPVVNWYLDGKEITSEGNIRIENVDYNSKFTISQGQRKQTGKYKIVATNEHGQDQEYVELVFLGPPSRPMGSYLHISYIEETIDITAIIHFLRPSGSQ